MGKQNGKWDGENIKLDTFSDIDFFNTAPTT
jgi:hypothetical protein